MKAYGQRTKAAHIPNLGIQWEWQASHADRFTSGKRAPDPDEE